MLKKNHYPEETTAEILRMTEKEVRDSLLKATEGTVCDVLYNEGVRWKFVRDDYMRLLFDDDKVDLDQPVAELELTAENVENLQVVRAQQGDDDSSDDDKVGDFRLSFDSDDVKIEDV